MSLMGELGAFIAENPGLTSREIAEQFADYSVDSVQRAVCRLYDFNFATRELQGTQYRYYAVADSDRVLPSQHHKQTVDKGLEDLIQKAEALQAGGLYRRAATLWLEIFNRSRITTLRERSLKQRQRCLRNAKLTTKTDSQWFLAGKFAGGHE